VFSVFNYTIFSWDSLDAVMKFPLATRSDNKIQYEGRKKGKKIKKLKKATVRSNTIGVLSTRINADDSCRGNLHQRNREEHWP
jgi:hypothetical protein